MKKLSDISEKDDRVIVSNVFSCMEAKGLEFDKVVLYNFGEDAGGLINESLAVAQEEEIEDSKSIHLSYFLNKLYVAVTRAKKEFFIIDSPQGEKNLWKYFFRSQSIFEQTPEEELEPKFAKNFWP